MGRDRMTNETWGEVQTHLRGQIGENNYITWIAPLDLASIDEGVVRLSAPTTFIANWVNRNFADPILRSILAQGVSAHRIEIDVVVRSKARQSAAARIQKAFVGTKTAPAYGDLEA